MGMLGSIPADIAQLIGSSLFLLYPYTVFKVTMDKLGNVPHRRRRARDSSDLGQLHISENLQGSVEVLVCWNQVLWNTRSSFSFLAQRVVTDRTHVVLDSR
jgi:hypothetical protein